MIEARQKLERVDLQAGKLTLNALCIDSLKGLRQSRKTLEGKAPIVERIKKEWPDQKRGEMQVKEGRVTTSRQLRHDQ